MHCNILYYLMPSAGKKAMLFVYNCPMNSLDFSLLTFPRIARYRPGPNSPHIRHVCARTHRGLCAKWRLEVTQRNRWTVRSRVHGRVKRPVRGSCLPPPPPQSVSFLQEDVSYVPHRPHPATTPATAHSLFSAFIKSSPGRKTTNIPTSVGAGEFSILHPFSAPWEIFCLQPSCEACYLFIFSREDWEFNVPPFQIFR